MRDLARRSLERAGGGLRWLSPILLAAFAVALGAEPADAYLDPTSGSIILQALIGGLVAGLYVLRTSWDKIKSRFRRRDDETQAPR